MKSYELLYIIDKDITEADRKKIVDRFKTFAEKNKATTVKIDEWGMKKLAYDINYKADGFYVLMSFDSPVDVPNKLTAELNLVEAVIRHKITEKIK